MADDSGKDDKVKTEAETASTDFDLELGDLSQFIDTDVSKSSPDLGDLSQLDSELSGDLSLLDEAIAELESENVTEAASNATELDAAIETPLSELSLMDEAAATESAADVSTNESSTSDFSLADSDDDVPTLQDAVAEVEHSGETHLESVAADTVPTLSESAIVSASQSSSPLTDAEALDELENIAEQLLEEEQSNLAAEAASSQADSSLSMLDEMNSPDELSPADSGLEITEPETRTSQFNESAFDAAMSSQAAESAAEIPVASAAGGRFANELQSHLASKIESLVMEAIASFSDDLNNQLAQQIQEMIIRAIDNALPAIMETMANSLKDEVETQVRTELPEIVDKMLGDISFAD